MTIDGPSTNETNCLLFTGAKKTRLHFLHNWFVYFGGGSILAVKIRIRAARHLLNESVFGLETLLTLNLYVHRLLRNRATIFSAFSETHDKGKESKNPPSRVCVLSVASRSVLK